MFLPGLSAVCLQSPDNYSVTGPNETVETGETGETLFFIVFYINYLACEKKEWNLANFQKVFPFYTLSHFGTHGARRHSQGTNDETVRGCACCGRMSPCQL